MPSRAYTSFLRRDDIYINFYDKYGFNALSGLYLISTKDYQTHSICILKFQCPLGLIPHFYTKEDLYEITPGLKFQCPLGLIPHFYFLIDFASYRPRNLFQCPLGLIPHFYGTPSKT